MKLKLLLLLALLVAFASCEHETKEQKTEQKQEQQQQQQQQAKNAEETVTRPPVPDVDLSDGFGGNITWVPYVDACKLNQDPNDNRPMLVLVFSPGCGSCKSCDSLSLSLCCFNFVKLSILRDHI